MSQQALEVIIALMCKTQEPYQNKTIHENRIECVVQTTNCAVKYDGKIVDLNTLVKECKFNGTVSN